MSNIKSLISINQISLLTSFQLNLNQKQNPQNIQLLNEVIIRNSFSLREKGQNQIKLAVTPSYILIYLLQEIQPFASLQINFDLKFQVLYEQQILTNKLQKKNLNNLKVGFSLFKKQYTNKVSFYSHDEQYLSLWIDYFSKKINQRGFQKIYQPLRQIGKGKYSTVFSALKKENKRRVAIKPFLKANFESNKKKQILINEISLLRTLNHQNILHLQEVFEDEQKIYAVFEQLQGGTLRQKMNATECKFQSHEIRQIMFDIIKGVQYLHSKRIMHRDLKPENILLRKKNSLQMVIADFGFATEVDIKNYIYYNCGTVGYVAPEILNMSNNKKYQPICDMFSVGSIFHLLLTKRSLFDGENKKQIYKNNKKMELNWEKPFYKRIDLNALELLKSLTKQNPLERISASKALNHEYFKCFNMKNQSKIQKVKSQKGLSKMKFLSKIKDKVSY